MVDVKITKPKTINGLDEEQPALQNCPFRTNQLPYSSVESSTGRISFTEDEQVNLWCGGGGCRPLGNIGKTFYS